MKVTIIIPCYNASAYIASSISSIQSQTLTDWEMIIVDDGSTDNSADIVQQFSNKDPRIKLVQKANGGTASARKLGLEHATGEYIQFLDADDSIDTDKLEKQVHLMQSQHLDVTYTDWKAAYTTGEFSRVCSGSFTLFHVLTLWGIFCTLPIHCFLYRKQFLMQHHITIPTHIKQREDWDFHIEVLSANPHIAHISGYCGAIYTMSPTSKINSVPLERFQMGNFKYLTYKINQSNGIKKILLNLRFSIELVLWTIRKVRYHYTKLISPQNKSNKLYTDKTLTVGIILSPIASIIVLSKIITSHINALICSKNT